MASSSTSLPGTWKYNVFTSFHGPDVRQTFLSHLRKQFNYNGITMFDDNGIERSHIIGPSLTQAIRASRIFIVVLSKNYASSSWCLDELLEILKCSENEQRVMTVFHGVDTSDVRKQDKDFGIAFDKTCACKTEEERRKWSQALTYVAEIAGEDFKNWKNEAEMVEKIAKDVSDKLNVTPSRDFDGMVGIEAHLRKVESLLDLDNDGVKIVGISGPAGIGKSTIARALHARNSNSFTLSCFMENLRGSCHGGSDEYSLKLRLQEQLLSKLLNLNGMTIRHLGVIKDRLHDQKVFIILDDVERLCQLEALANIGWFGHGSRVIVTTENKEILKQHGINDIYHVDFPSRSEALMIFCLSAFRQTSPPVEFVDLADEVVRICSNLPLGLHVLGSSLRDKSKDDWIEELPMLKNCLDGRIESVLKVGYESLHEKDQVLFLFIAVFFNYEHVDYITTMLAKSNWKFRLGLKTLANKYLIHIEQRLTWAESRVVMHNLLQVMARQVICRQESSKRQILVDPQEICTVLENAEGTGGSIVGVSFDVAEINDLMISPKAFEKMCNLFFLKVYNSQEIQLPIPEDFEFPRRLRLLHWEAYPKKSLPLRFCPVNLVNLNMPNSKLKKLWEGTKLLVNLKKMDLSRSSRLKELPDLSNATKLEELDVHECIALVELPSSISNLTKLEHLNMMYCESLEVIPRLINLASKYISMAGCSRLSSFLDLPTKIGHLTVVGTAVEELPASLTYCSRLQIVNLSENGNLKAFLTELPTSVRWLNLSKSGIERITDSIKGLHNLQTLDISECKRLVSLPELPCWLDNLNAENCDSLVRVCGPFNTPNARLNFRNCFKLDQKARQAIIQQFFVRGWGLFPGRKVPLKFNHRARGNSLKTPYSASNRFQVCVVISPTDIPIDHKETLIYEYMLRQLFPMRYLSCRCIVIGDSVNSTDMKFNIDGLQLEHLFIFHIYLPSEERRKIVFEFSIINPKLSGVDKNFEIIECGVEILTDETNRNNNGESGDEDNFQVAIIANGRSESESGDQDNCNDLWNENLEIIECGVEILTDETNRNNNGESGDEDNCSDFRDAHESEEASDKEEDDNDTIANGRSESESESEYESCQVSDKEDDEEEYKSEYGESGDEDNCSDFQDAVIANGRSESESESESGHKEDDEEGYKSEYGEASNNKVENIADGEGEYQSVSRKRKMTSATTHLRKEIQRPLSFKNKKKKKTESFFKKFRHCIGTLGQNKANEEEKEG